MAEYRKLAADLIAADGVIDDTEVRLMKKHLYADGKIIKAEVDFLLEVRIAVARKAKSAEDTVKFDRFLLKACADYILDTKTLTEAQLELIKKVAGDKKLDTAEVKKFLNKMKKENAGNDKIEKIHEDWTKKQEAAK